jgi:hypothetical protein
VALGDAEFREHVSYELIGILSRVFGSHLGSDVGEHLFEANLLLVGDDVVVFLSGEYQCDVFEVVDEFGPGDAGAQT